jgi:biotin carboxyl carrier protein
VKYYVTVNGHEHEVELVERLGELQVRYDGRPVAVRHEEVDRLGQVALFLREEGQDCDRSFAVSIEGDASEVRVSVAGHLYQVEIEDERERAAHDAERRSRKGGGDIKSVMPGVVAKLLIGVGDVVERGQPLLILEAMKMQNEIASPRPGRVSVLHVQEGQAVASGSKLVSLESLETELSAD